MLKLKVKYFLNKEGWPLFESWYDKVLKITSIQKGFINISFIKYAASRVAIVYLNFSNQENLDNWANTEVHDILASEIESYCIKPLVVEFKKTGD